MRREVAGLCESFVAVGIVADIRFLACMRPKMSAEVEVKRESFVAESTLEWFLASMHKLVAL